MAVTIPHRPTDFHGSSGEREVLDALRRLPDRCVVFHSVNWLRRGGPKRSPEGEGDFVVADPERGLLVIEVKSGGIRVDRGQWFQRNRVDGVERPMKNPVEQANRTRWFLWELLQDEFGKAFRFPVSHGVWFPSVQFPGDGLPLDCPPAIILDKQSLLDPIAGIDRVFEFRSGAAPGMAATPAQFKKVLSIIAPTFNVVPSVRQAIEDRERAFVQLTAEQARVLDYLEEQDRAVVAGAAGTGKTMVALEQARRLAASGNEVFFLCFNKGLRSVLQASHGAPRLQFHTFDSLAVAESPELAGDFTRAREALLDRLTLPGSDGLPNVIIDEGQDFEEEWVSTLEACTRGIFYVFHDRNQLIQLGVIPSWVRDAECRLVLRRACRSTTQISRFAYKVMGLQPAADTVDGPRPKLHVCDSRTEASVRVGEVLMDLLDRGGLHPEEMALITLGTTGESLMPPFSRVGSIPVAEVPTRGSITWSTVRKFKGLEAKAVVLVDVSPADLTKIESRRLLYVGASRAVHELHVVLHDCTSDGISAMAAALLGPGKKRNAHALAGELGATLA